MASTKLLEAINCSNVGMKNRISDAFARAHGRPDEIVDPANPSNKIPNPQAKDDFMREIIITFIRETVEGAEANSAADTARELARTKAKNEIIPT